MSLLQDVLKAKTANESVIISDKLKSLSFSQGASSADEDSDDELVNVISVPGTPNRTRPSSPTSRAAGASARRVPGPLHLSSRRDPLKSLPTEISQKVFARLSVKDLARCALVSKKWSRSQTINYVWFQHYRKENFHDESLPQGKWTKRESKQNWRTTYIQSTSRGDRSPTAKGAFSISSGYSSPSLSGYQTPRELKEEQWRLEAEITAKPGKLEMREMYKDLGGRKSKDKSKGRSTGIRDKSGWGEEYY